MELDLELERFGPGHEEVLSLREAQAYCLHLARTHYENFSVVIWLTPRGLREDFAAIYAFCRWADDLGDEVGDPARSLELLGWWRQELRAMYAGQARHPVMVALEPVVKRHGIPIGPFEALIAAFEQDQTVHEYETDAQLRDYCTRSANPVGHLVLYACGAFDAENARLANATCTGLQLANFWQDVARDWQMGRIYLPAADRFRFGVTHEMLAAVPAAAEFRALLRSKVAEARLLFTEGRPLVDRLRGRVRLAVDLFSRGGLAILEAIERADYDVLSARPHLSQWDKLGLMARSAWSSMRRWGSSNSPERIVSSEGAVLAGGRSGTEHVG
jgi:squalene synthase HpnC